MRNKFLSAVALLLGIYAESEIHNAEAADQVEGAFKELSMARYRAEDLEYKARMAAREAEKARVKADEQELTVKRLIDELPEEEFNRHVTSILCRGVVNGNADIVRQIIERLGSQTIDLAAPLTFAASQDNEDILDQILQLVNQDTLKSFDAIEALSQDGRGLPYHITKKILDHLSQKDMILDFDSVGWKRDPLYLSIMYDDYVDTVELFLDYMVAKGIKISREYLLDAARRGASEMAEVILKRISPEEMNFFDEHTATVLDELIYHNSPLTEQFRSYGAKTKEELTAQK